MNNYVFTSRTTGKTIKRVTKSEARRLFNQGIDIQIIPCKCNPTSLYYTGIWYNSAATDADFDTLVRNFEVYNCNYNETGKYAAFYVEEA